MIPVAGGGEFDEAFTDAQIAFVLKQAEDGTSVAEVLPHGGDCRSDVRYLAQAVCRPDAAGDEAAEAA